MTKVLYWSDESAVDRDFVVKASENFGHLDGLELLQVFMRDLMPGRIALVSSFGTEAAILLHMASQIDQAAPVLFIDTQKLFPETLHYRDALIAQLGLTNVQTITPDTTRLAQEDTSGTLWQFSPDRCCHVRKVEPLERALQPYSGWITGRKRAHGGQRQNLPLIELFDGKLKLNPLANWTMADINTYFETHALPRHPLVAQGFLSLGCTHCTAKPADANDPRSGRWAGSEKTECGIHFENGKIVRKAT